MSDADLRALERAYAADPTPTGLGRLLAEAARRGRTTQVRPDGSVALDPPAGVDEGTRLLQWDFHLTPTQSQVVEFNDLNVILDGPVVLGRILASLYVNRRLDDPTPDPVGIRATVERCPGETVIRLRYLKPDPVALAALGERMRANREAAERERAEGLASGRLRECSRCERAVEAEHVDGESVCDYCREREFDEGEIQLPDEIQEVLGDEGDRDHTWGGFEP